MKSLERTNEQTRHTEASKAGRCTWVAKIDHGVKLVEAVLQRGAGEQDALLCLERCECRARLRGIVLEPVRLVADEQIHLVLSVPFAHTHVRK